MKIGVNIVRKAIIFPNSSISSNHTTQIDNKIILYHIQGKITITFLLDKSYKIELFGVDKILIAYSNQIRFDTKAFQSLQFVEVWTPN